MLILRRFYTTSNTNEILSRAMKFIPEYGFGRKAIMEAAKDLNLSSAVASTIGGKKTATSLLIEFTMKNATEEMRKDILKKFPDNRLNCELIEFGIGHRLEFIRPFRRHWPKAIAVMLMPENVGSLVRQSGEFADTICNADEKEIFQNYYKNRSVICAGWFSSEMFWIQNDDENEVREFVGKVAANCGNVLGGIDVLEKNRLLFSQTADVIWRRLFC
ncbi:hypothetical protein SNEBB_001717 [Seison nebaliae]|nr:hypothetical protein SNEBB_001717 [Seison nebaliae]